LGANSDANLNTNAPNVHLNDLDGEPPDGGELGRATWTFLHTLAAYYPENPTMQEKEEMKGFIRTFSRFYPCGYCAAHLREQLKVSEPDTSSQKGFSLWMCQLHNEVNELLGKKLFDCSRVDERWRGDHWFSPFEKNCFSSCTFFD